MSYKPALLCVVSVPLASVRTPSGQQKRPERISPVLLVSSAALSAPAPGSSMWDLDVDFSEILNRFVESLIFILKPS